MNRAEVKESTLKDAIAIFMESPEGRKATAAAESRQKRLEAARELRTVKAGKAEKILAARVAYLATEEGVTKARAAMDMALSRRGDALSALNTTANEIDRRVQELTYILTSTAPEYLVAKREALRQELDDTISRDRDKFGGPGDSPEKNLKAKLDRVEKVKAAIKAVEDEILNPQNEERS